MLTLEEMGIPVEYAQHEDAPSQHEIDLRYTDALTMADTVMTVRLVVKEIAQRQGVHASFMPKPLAGVQGSGMHTHLSLFEGDTNAFYDDSDDPYGLSEVAKRFIAGLLRHAREITAVTNQWVNSYKRLIVGYEAPDPRVVGPQQPLGAGPGAGRSSAASTSRPGSSTGPRTRRATPTWPSPSSWPPGSTGIEEGYELPREAAANLFDHDARGAGRRGHPSRCRPASTRRVDEMEHSELVAETLGEHVFEWFMRNKRAEWAAYKTQISQFELDRYFPLL